MATAGPVGRAFGRYRAEVIPAEASDVQVHECRKAFYAGAWVMLMHLAVDPAITDAQRRLIHELQEECDAFSLQLLRPDGPAIH